MGDLDTGRTIRFDTANRAASHLGRRLYGTTPPALAELVANPSRLASKSGRGAEDVVGGGAA